MHICIIIFCMSIHIYIRIVTSVVSMDKRRSVSTAGYLTSCITFLNDKIFEKSAVRDFESNIFENEVGL